MKQFFIALVLFICIPCALAETIEVEYKSFYSHVRKLQQEDTNKLQFGFGFVNIHTQQLCELNRAQIVTPKKTIPLFISQENRFTVPSERALKLADAIVQIDFSGQANQCDMSVQLETKPEVLKRSYSKTELLDIVDQYGAFFNEMGSFLSFLMPSVRGLMITFEDKALVKELPNDLKISKGVLILEDNAIADIDNLTLPVKPVRISVLSKR